MPANPLSQSDAYANTLRALGTDVRIDLISRVTPPARCLIQTRRLPVLGRVTLISRGPVGLSSKDTVAYLQDVRVKGPLIINADVAPTGCLRVASPRTVALLSLGDPTDMRAALHQKWRNGLRRAEKAGLSVTITPYHPHQHRWLIDSDREQQTARRYRNWPQVLLDTFARENPGQTRVVTAFRGRVPLAAMLVLCHRPWATYHLGFATHEGRRANAHTLTLWHVMGWLASRGYTTLDLGLLGGPPGLDRFKLRTGATASQLGGTWVRLPALLRRQFPSIQIPSGQKA